MTEIKELDPDSAAAMEVVTLEQRRDENALSDQERKEQLIAKTYKMMGQIEAADMFTKMGVAASLVWLKQVKETKTYKDLPGIETWERFCNHIGKSRRVIDEQLQNLQIFGEEFLASAASLSIGQKDFRKLRKSVAEGEVVIEAEVIRIGDEEISFSPEHKDDLQAALEEMIDSKQQLAKEKADAIRTKTRVIDSLHETIDKRDKVIAKFEKKAEEKGYEAGEEEKIKQIEALQTSFDGFAIKIDPENNICLLNQTDRVKARYFAALGYMKRVLEATWDTAMAEYGQPGDEPDEKWVQPGRDSEGLD
jgi:hypothetical protein